jgi:hypothetical protein
MDWSLQSISYVFIQFCKSQEIYLKESANTYPTNIAGIDNVNDGGYNLALLSQFDKQGFLLWIIWSMD